jgi:hypothetical protein
MDVDAVGLRQFSTSAVTGPKATGFTRVFGAGGRDHSLTSGQALGSGDLVGYLTYVMD